MPVVTSFKPKMLDLECDVHFTVSIDPGPARARRSPYLDMGNKVKPKKWQPAYPHYLITTKVLFSCAKESIPIPQVGKAWMGHFINSPFTIVRLLAINAKNLQSMLTHGMDKLTLELSHTIEELNIIY